jgi:hypothetical protein
VRVTLVGSKMPTLPRMVLTTKVAKASP